jgi:hypothetical protein
VVLIVGFALAITADAQLAVFPARQPAADHAGKPTSSWQAVAPGRTRATLGSLALLALGEVGIPASAASSMGANVDRIVGSAVA